MSLVAAALRLCARQTLRGATTAGDRVHDSKVSPVDLIKDDPALRIILNTDEGGKDKDGPFIVMNVDLFIAAAKKVELADDDGEAYEIEFELSDANNALALDELGFEVDATLRDAVTPWGNLFRTFANIDEAGWEAGAAANDGRRFAYSRLQYQLRPLCEPIRGKALVGVWDALLALMDQSTDTAISNRAKLWRGLLTTPDLPSWRRAMAELRLPIDAARDLAVAPMDGDMTTPPAAVSEFAVDVGDDDHAIEVNADGAAMVTDDGTVPLVEP